MIVVGVLSDTHGHLYPEVRELLTGVDHIVHAGDVGSPHVLEELRAIAPVTVVRGNCDNGSWARDLPVRTEVELEGVRILVSHVAGRLREAVAAREDKSRSVSSSTGPVVVISGHSHSASVEETDEVLYVNPGSAGPHRFGRPRTVGRLEISPDRCAEQSAELTPTANGRRRHGGADDGSRPQVTVTIIAAEAERRTKSSA